MNANDISGKRFEKAAFGYKPEEVEDFLRQVAEEFAALKREKEDTDRKIQVLADKIREYRNDEEALKEALIGAQRQGHQVISDANAKAERIIADAEAKAQSIVGDAQTKLDRLEYDTKIAKEKAVGEIRKSMESEKKQYEMMKQEAANFKSQLLSLYKSHLDLITALPNVTAAEPAKPSEPAPKPVEAVSAPKPEPVAQPVAPAPTAAAPQSASAQEASAAPKSAFPFSDRQPRPSGESRFGELKFGKNDK